MSGVRNCRLAVGSAILIGALLPSGVYAQTDTVRDGGCRLRCHQLARDILHECRAEDGDAQRCRHRAKEAFARCVEENCSTQDDCESRCRHGSADRLDACLSAGGTLEECEKQAGDFLVRCVLQNCKHKPGCEEHCRFNARRFLRHCLADGGDRERCSIQAREMYKTCVHRCSLVCGGLVGLPCEDDEFCKMPPGTCEVSDGFGVCSPSEGVCTADWDPVCGCDGRTYGNECTAGLASVSIAHRGECRDACDPALEDQCREGSFCRSPIGHCDATDVAGECVILPDSCLVEHRTVCGCDSVTYDSPCEADRAGVSVAHLGGCRVSCTAGGGECTDMQFCRLPDGDCTDTAAGFCAPPPLDCGDERHPVCGCDGVTYANRCEAIHAGAAIHHLGECR